MTDWHPGSSICYLLVELGLTVRWAPIEKTLLSMQNPLLGFWFHANWGRSARWCCNSQSLEPYTV